MHEKRELAGSNEWGTFSKQASHQDCRSRQQRGGPTGYLREIRRTHPSPAEQRKTSELVKSQHLSRLMIRSGRSSSCLRLPADSLSELTLFSLLAEQPTGFNSIYNKCSLPGRCRAALIGCFAAGLEQSGKRLCVSLTYQSGGRFAFGTSFLLWDPKKNLPESKSSKWTGRQASVFQTRSWKWKVTGWNVWSYSFHRRCRPHADPGTCLFGLLAWIPRVCSRPFQQNNVGTNQSSSAQNRILQVQTCGRFSSLSLHGQDEFSLWVKHIITFLYAAATTRPSNKHATLKVPQWKRQKKVKFLSQVDVCTCDPSSCFAED